nr:MAG TPA: hypothetical protein [Caudoviricetes sp.]
MSHHTAGNGTPIQRFNRIGGAVIDQGTIQSRLCVSSGVE